MFCFNQTQHAQEVAVSSLDTETPNSRIKIHIQVNHRGMGLGDGGWRSPSVFFPRRVAKGRMVDGLNGVFLAGHVGGEQTTTRTTYKGGGDQEKDKSCWPAGTFTSVYFLHIVQMNLQVGYLNAVDMHFEAMDYR